MTDPNPRGHTDPEERASLYVLDLLDASDRQAFEHQLRRDAELRGLVHGFQSALEAEVFGEPAPSAPARVWGKILERTRMDGAQVLLFPEPLRRWIPRLAAMAACFTLGALLQPLWTAGGRTEVARNAGGSSPSGVSGTVHPAEQLPGLATAGSDIEPSPIAPGGILSSKGSVTSVIATAEATVPVDRDEALALENAALQGRIRGLNAQVTELSQQVQQLTLIPSGVSRLHVFPLGQPGVTTTLPPGGIDGLGRTNSLAESLARLAGERMAAALASGSPTGSPPEVAAAVARQAGPSTPTAAPSAGVESVGKVALVPAQPLPPEAVVASAGSQTPPQIPGLASVAFTDPTQNRGLMAGAMPGAIPPGNPAANLAPIVFSAPDSGVHAVAVPTAPPGGQYQLWNRGADGTVSSLGVLTPSGSPVSVVTFERSTVDGLFMSLEPVGGSLQPTGPIVGGAQNPVLPGLGKP